MSALESVVERQERPAYVRFEKRPVEDKAASLAAGRYVAKDVDYALISPPYSKDVVVQKVDAWLKQLDQDVAMERLPAKWRDAYREGYAKWQAGQEMPLHGTPIRGWPVISPAQQENLIRMNILTVEDMAHINDEGARRLGMGWLELKNKALAWLQQAEDKGPLTMEVAELKKVNANQAAQIEAMQQQISALTARIAEPQAEKPSTISADDILPERQTLSLKGSGRGRT